MGANILLAGVAAAIAKEAGERVDTAGCEFASKDIERFSFLRVIRVECYPIEKRILR